MEDRPLWDWVKYFFTKYIYRPHQHDWQFDRNERVYTSGLGLEFTGTDLVYKCNCGELVRLSRES